MSRVISTKNMQPTMQSATQSSPTLKGKRKTSAASQAESEIPPTLDLAATATAKITDSTVTVTTTVTIPPSSATTVAIEPVVELKPEPLLVDNEDRFVIFPIKHPDIWAKYKQHMAVFWTPEEIDLAKDVKDWTEKLNDNELFANKSSSERLTAVNIWRMHAS